MGRDDGSVAWGIVKAALATAAYAGVHSALATNTVKDAAERAVGARARNAFYRPTFNVVAVASLAGLVLYVRSLPDRPLYAVRGPGRWAMRVGQVLGVGYLGWAAVSQDTLGFVGLPGLWAYVTGKRQVPREPAAQGPSVDDSGRRIAAVGPFARTRQPANAAFVPILWFNPTMTAKWAAVCAATTVYSLVGSLHSEAVLRAAYGWRYDRYRRGRPMFVPTWGPGRIKANIERRSRKGPQRLLPRQSALGRL